MVILAALALCAAPWLLWLVPRYGAVLGALVTLAAAPVLVLAVFFTGPWVGADLVSMLLAAGGAAGATGLAVLWRDRRSLRPPHRSTVLRWAGAAAGGAAWLAALLIARVLPDADPVSWAMNGDAANNLHFARGMIEANGYALSSGNAVPLPAALLALTALPGRAGLHGGALLGHDLAALAALWALAIAAAGLMLGLVVSSLVRTPSSTVLAATTGSLLVTTWLVAGLPIESGYLNAPIALTFLLASWLAFTHSRTAPVLATVVLLGLGVALLAIWTPLAAVTGCLLLASLWLHRHEVNAARRGSVIAIAAALAAYPIWVAAVAIPLFGEVGGVFTVEGHGFPFTGWLLLAAAVAAVGMAVALRARLAPEVLAGAVALVLAAAAGMLLLIGLAGGRDADSSYYPTKFTWLLTVLLIAVALALLARLLSERARWPGVAAIGTIALVASSLGPSPVRAVPVVEPPLWRILAGSVWDAGDVTVHRILDLHDRGRITVLWDSGVPDEAIINFWLLELGDGQSDDGQLARSFTYAGYREFRDTGSYTVPPIGTLCTVLAELPREPLIITADPSLEHALTAQCPAESAEVELRE